jgi:hypothetical protein
LGGPGRLIEDYVPPVAQHAVPGLKALGDVSRLAEGVVDPFVQGQELARSVRDPALGALAGLAKSQATPKKGLPPVKKNVEAIRTSAEDLVQRMDTPQVAETIRKRLMNLAKRNNE